MQTETIDKKLLARNLVLETPGWDERVAHTVSQAASPPVLGIAASLLVAYHLSTKQALVWSGVYIVLAVLAPVIFLLWLIRRGRVGDLDIQSREQRVLPFLLAVVGGAGAWSVLTLGAAPLLLIGLAGTTATLLALLLGITFRWKISVHCSMAAGFAVLVWGIFDQSLVPAGVVPLVAWSRIRLSRHTVFQSVAGIFLGAAVFMIGLAASRWNEDPMMRVVSNHGFLRKN